MRRIPAFASSLTVAAAMALPLPALAVTPAQVLTTYADIAEAGYADSLSTAQALRVAIESFLAARSAEGLEAARAAWRAARAPGNAEGEAVIMGAVEALVAQTRDIERVIAALDLSGVALEGSDSLDNPSAVFQ